LTKYRSRAAVGPGEGRDRRRGAGAPEPGAGLAQRPVEAEGPAEVPAGAAGNERETGVGRDSGPGLEEAIHHLVEGPVASDGDDAPEAVLERLGGEGGGVHGTLGEGVLGAVPERAQDLGADLRPAAAGGAAGALGFTTRKVRIGVGSHCRMPPDRRSQESAVDAVQQPQVLVSPGPGAPR
jgi:hypothetical protein